MPVHVSSTMCSSSGGQKLYYAASGIITPIGGRPLHRLRESSLDLCKGWPPIGVMIPEAVQYNFWPDNEHIVLETSRGMK